MRIKHKVNVRIAEDTEMKNLWFGPDDSLSEVVIDSYGKMATIPFAIAANTSESLSLGDVDAVHGFYLRADKDVTVKLNGEATGHQMRRNSTASTAVAKMFAEMDLSSIEVTAPATEAVSGVLVVWGDPS